MNSRVAALVLAAGASSRMHGPNKLLCRIGAATLVERAVRAAVESRCERVVVVTGWQAQSVEAALEQVASFKPVSVARNPRYFEGLSSSLRFAVGMLPEALDAAVVLLADMPWIGAAHIDALLGAFDPREPAIVVPVRGGRRGHPVLWPRRFFAPLAALAGDVGGRELLERHAAQLRAVPFETDAIFQDVDTPQQLQRAQQALAAAAEAKPDD